MSELDDIKRRVEELSRELTHLREQVRSIESGTTEPKRAPSAVGHPGPVPSASAPSGSLAHLFADISANPEQFFGGNLLGKLGLLAMVLASSWFIKLAIDRGWLNESARVYNGLLLGLSLQTLALFLAKRKYRILPGSLLGAGGAILYLAIWGSYYYYDLLTLQESFLSLVVLTLWLAGMAAVADSEVLYSFGLLGAFLAPFLLSRGENAYQFLFGYIAIMNALYFLVSFRRPWRITPYLLLGADALLYALWNAKNGDESGFLVPLLFLAFVYLLFPVRELFVLPRFGFRPDRKSLGLLFLSSLFFVWAALDQVWQHYRGQEYLVLLGVAIFAIALESAGTRWNALKGKRTDRSGILSLELRSFLLTLWSVALSGALFRAFGGEWLIAMGLAFSGALTIAGVALRRERLMWLSLPAWLIAVLFLTFGTGYERSVYTPLWNGRMALHLMGVLFLFTALYMQRRRNTGKFQGLLGYFALSLLILSFFRENHDLIENVHYRNLGYSYVLALFSLLLFIAGFVKSRSELRAGAIVLALLVVAKLYFYDVWTMSRIVRIIAGFTLGVALIALSIYYQRKRKMIEEKEGVQ